MRIRSFKLRLVAGRHFLYSFRLHAPRGRRERLGKLAHGADQTVRHVYFYAKGL